MLTIAVCDDNKAFGQSLVEKLRHLCISLPERIVCNVTEVFTSADEVLKYLSHSTVNILFLDIDMPGTNGFELAGAVRKTFPDTVIIFVSAYDNFVYSSFDYAPFRFLRKSHIDEELSDTFEKVIEKCTTSDLAMTFTTTDGDITVRLRDICYFEAQGNYFLIHHVNRQVYKCRGTISQLETQTASLDFFRIHAAFIVNLENIERITEGSTLLMKNGSTLSISRNRIKNFKNTYMNFTRRRIIL